MKTFFQALFLISTFSTLLFSCTKNTGPAEPVIILTSPTDTTTINAGDTVQIVGSVSDNKDLHEFYFTLKNNTTDTVEFYDNPYVHGAKIHHFTYQWITGDSAAYKLIIQVLDHESHTSTKELVVKVN